MVDLPCGHVLIDQLMPRLGDRSKTALAVDRNLPRSAGLVSAALVREWPRLQGRIEIVQGVIAEGALTQDGPVVSAHACRDLTDEVIKFARAGPKAPSRDRPMQRWVRLDNFLMNVPVALNAGRPNAPPAAG